MAKVKTRPENNFHCFEGTGLPYWRAIASGFRPTELKSGPEGSRWELQADVDGYALQNGGMTAPQVVKLAPNTYFRFFGTIAHNRYGAESGLTGGWWIDADTLAVIQRFSEEHNRSIAQTASLMLVIPNDWHDCGYLGYAMLTRPMKAFVGQGKPAASVSPASALRPATGSLVTGLPHLQIKQYFVPGTRAEIGDSFRLIWTKQVTKPGAVLDFAAFG